MARNNRLANLVAEIDAISELCDQKGFSKIAEDLMIAGEELLSDETPKVEAATDARQDAKTLRAAAREMGRRGERVQAGRLLRMADELEEELGIDLDTPSSLDDAAAAPEAGEPAAPEVPAAPATANEDPECIQCPCSCHKEHVDVVQETTEPSEEATLAAVSLLERKMKAMAATTTADAEDDDPESSLRALNDALAKDASADIVSDIDALEAQLLARAQKGRSARRAERKAPSDPKVANASKREIQQMARDMEQRGQHRLARRIRALIS